VDYSGKIGGTAVGVAMFDHPANPNFPTYWMARGYGLLAANATGAREFTGDQKLDGTLTIPKGGKLEFHHLLVIHPGDAKTAGIEALYRSFAAKK
jgi:coproporphyrinogen III oxidase